LIFAAACVLVLPFAAQAQITSNPDVNVSEKIEYQNECAIIKNPTNHQELFAACNNANGGLFAARSTNLGVTWTYPDATDQTLADGDPGQGPLACCDPTLAWDSFGNLYLGYLDNMAANVVVLISTDGGLTFNTLATFPGSVDQPTVVAADTTAPGAPVAVWVVWNNNGSMRASGAAVTGLGTVGAFVAVQAIPGTNNCSFGDIAIAPSGVVVQTCQNPTGGQGPGSIQVNTDPDGLGLANFGAAVMATATNVGGFDFIPAQNVRSVDAEAGLAYDRFPASPHFGRLYLVYTDETVDENNDTDIMLRYSDDDGATWSAPIRVNDDPANPVRSQFLPKIATNPLSGNIAVCWHDARNSANNDSMQEFCTIATPATADPVFLANSQVGDALTSGNGSNPPVAGQADIQFGDYSGLSYFQGRVHPIWADVSNSTGDNPDGTMRFDAYTDLVQGGTMAMEGDPHIVTVDGVQFDFQGGGEYTVVLDSDGTEIQARHAPIATSFTVGPSAHTGLTSCVSLTTAVAARVGGHRVTYQPNLSGVPDPSGLQLRVDGILTTVGPAGIDLGDGGRMTKTAAAGGIEIEFPNGTHLIVAPGWWSTMSTWYLNLNISRTPALEGIMGDVVDGWLPRLPDGTSLGSKPSSLSDRYIDLYRILGDAWRVTTVTSLFDYAPGTSTKTFTFSSWPPQTAPCSVPKQTPLQKLYPEGQALEACKRVRNASRRANCVFDVRVTSDPNFARTYELTETLLAGATVTTVTADKNPTVFAQPVTFTAVVERKVPNRESGAPAGTVQFMIDDVEAGIATLDARGQATWKGTFSKIGTFRVTATYKPLQGSSLLPSNGEVTHTVGGK
jgi:hypothetical protein